MNETKRYYEAKSKYEEAVCELRELGYEYDKLKDLTYVPTELIENHTALDWYLTANQYRHEMKDISGVYDPFL